MFYFNVFSTFPSPQTSSPNPPRPIHPSDAGGSTPSRRARRPDNDGTGTFSTLRRRVEKLRRWSGDLSEVTFQVGENGWAMKKTERLVGLYRGWNFLPSYIGIIS